MIILGFLGIGFMAYRRKQPDRRFGSFDLPSISAKEMPPSRGLFVGHYCAGYPLKRGS